MTFQSYPKISYQTIQENVAQLQAKQNKLNESVKPQIIGYVKKPGAFANLKEDSQAFIESVSNCLYNRLAYIIYESVWLDKTAKEQLKESLILELVEGFFHLHHALGERARQAGELLRADDDQRHGKDDDHFRKTDSKHKEVPQEGWSDG